MQQQRRAREREIWRHGLALTGDPEGATAVLVRVWKANTDVLRLSRARTVRLVAAGARRWLAGGHRFGRGLGAGPAPAPDAAGALGALDQEQREAWILRYVVGLSDADIGDALGRAHEDVDALCESADRELTRQLGSGSASRIQALRDRLAGDADDVAFERARARFDRIVLRKRAVGVVQFVLLLTVMGLMVWVGLTMLDAQRARDEGRLPGDELSVPMPEPNDAP